jgi:hypothetical protein
MATHVSWYSSILHYVEKIIDYALVPQGGPRLVVLKYHTLLYLLSTYLVVHRVLKNTNIPMVRYNMQLYICFCLFSSPTKFYWISLGRLGGEKIRP